MESGANFLLTNVFGHTHITVSLDDENVYDAIKFRSSFMIKITSPEEVFDRHADDLVLYYPDYHREAGEQPLPGKRRRKRSRSPSERGKRSRSSPSIRDDEKPRRKRIRDNQQQSRKRPGRLQALNKSAVKSAPSRPHQYPTANSRVVGQNTGRSTRPVRKSTTTGPEEDD